MATRRRSACTVDWRQIDDKCNAGMVLGVLMQELGAVEAHAPGRARQPSHYESDAGSVTYLRDVTIVIRTLRLSR